VIAQCTFDGLGSGVSLYNLTATAEFTANSITSCNYGVDAIGTVSQPDFDCNNAWGNFSPYHGLTDPTGTDGNFSANPYYDGNGDFRVRPSSPNVQTLSCGRVGALGIGAKGGGDLSIPSLSTIEYFDDVPFDGNRTLIIAPNPTLTSGTEILVTVLGTGGPLADADVEWIFGDGLNACPGANLSGTTNEDGEVLLSGAGGGFGWSEIRVEYEGVEFSLTGGEVRTLSPDSDGNLDVNVGDLSFISGEFLFMDHRLEHAYDYNGVVDLSDLVVFSPHFADRSQCQGAGAGSGLSRVGEPLESREELVALIEAAVGSATKAEDVVRARELLQDLTGGKAAAPGGPHPSIVAADPRPQPPLPG